MWGGARRCDRVENRLRQVFAKKDAALFQLQTLGHLIMQRQAAQASYLLARQAALRQPILQSRQEARVPKPHAFFVISARRFGAPARSDVECFLLRVVASFE